MNVRLYNISIKCMLAILLAGLFASCKDEMDEYEGDRPSRLDVLGLKFTAFEEGFEKPTTRSIVNSVDDIDYVGVLSMKKKDSESVWSRVFDNDTLVITNERKEIWYYPNDKKKKWEPEYNYKFRGFYPIKGNFNESAGESCENGFEFSIGQTELRLNNYKMATDPRDNSDLLVSQIVERRKGETDVVAMNMKHILACVNFDFVSKTSEEAHVTDLKVVGYAKEGDYSDAGWEPRPKTISASGKNDLLTIDVTYTGQGGQYIWVPELGQNVSYPPNLVLASQNGVVFKDKETHEVISTVDVFNLDGGKGYLKQGSPYYKKFYVVPAQSESLKNEGESSISNCEGLLFIPQGLYRGVENTVNLKINLKRADHGWSTNTIDIEGIVLNRTVSAEIEFYFGNTDPGPGNRLQATVDLTANDQIKEWEAGKKYNYTVGLYEYQATANIFVEDWTHHTYEEELK